MNSRVIAIDGPAGSGKSTTARRVAEGLGYVYIDTGAMYRAVALAVLEHKLEPTQETLDKFLPQLTIRLAVGPAGQQTYLNETNVSTAIRTPEVTALVSRIAALPNVRQYLVEMQRRMAGEGGIVMDGRDIGTNVFPDAAVKIFMIASPEQRARRRWQEMRAGGIDASYEEILTQIQERDRQDSERATDPLRKAADAHVIDTSDLNIEQQSAKVLEIVRALDG